MAAEVVCDGTSARASKLPLAGHFQALDQTASLAELIRRAEAFGPAPFFTFVHADADVDADVAAEAATFTGYVDAALRLAACLDDQGVGAGNRVAVIGRPDLHFVTTVGAALLVGATVLPVNRLLREREVAAYLRSVRADHVYVDSSTWAAVRPALTTGALSMTTISLDELPGTRTLDASTGPRLALRRVDPDGPGVVMHTSGTTALPKAVLHSQRDYAQFLAEWAQWMVAPGDRVLCYAPYYHISGLLQSFFAALAVGAPLVQLESFSARTFWRRVAQAQATVTAFIPPVASYLLAQPASPDDRGHTLTHAVLAGRSDHWNEFQARFGIAGHSGYASTETLICSLTGTRTSPPVAPDRLAEPGLLAGKPLAGWAQLRIVDDGDRVVPAGVTGHIQARGRALFRGYLDDTVTTAAAFTPDGWFRTGDSGYEHASGDFYLLERTNDLIRRSSELISPAEVESVLLDHPQVVDAAVVPVVDDLREQEVRACLVLAEGAATTAAEIFEHCNARLARFKVPRYLEFRGTLPRTANNKLKRSELVAEADPSRWTDRLG